MRRIEISPVAQAQLDHIYEYTLGRWGKAQAVTYTDGLMERFLRIAADEISSRPIGAQLGVDGFYLRYESHYIYWQRDAGDILIVAILHRSMEQTVQLRAAINDL